MGKGRRLSNIILFFTSSENSLAQEHKMGQMGIIKIIYMANPIHSSEWKIMAVWKSLVGVRDVATKKEHVEAPVIDAEMNVPVSSLTL